MILVKLMVFSLPTESIITDDILCNEKKLHRKMVINVLVVGQQYLFFIWFRLHSSPYNPQLRDYCRELTSTQNQLQGLNQVTSEFVVLLTELSTFLVSVLGECTFLYHLYQHDTKSLRIISTICHLPLISFFCSTSKASIAGEMA